MARVSVIALAALLALAQVPVDAQGPATATSAWVVEPGDGASFTSAYAVIENPSMYEVYVVAVATDAAASADIAQGAADAAKPMKELPVPAYGQTELTPGGIHIRLKDLRRPLKAGDSVELTLTLDSGATIKVTAPVRKG